MQKYTLLQQEIVGMGLIMSRKLAMIPLVPWLTSCINIVIYV